MAITLDTNLISLQQNLNISTMRMKNYANKSIDDVIEAEARLGNKKAVEYSKELFKNEDEFIEAFKLDDPANKYRILTEMQAADILEILPNVELKDLVLGLNFFTKENILTLLKEVPIEQVIAVALTLFPIEDLLAMIPEAELDNFVVNREITKNTMLKKLKELPPEILAVMIETVTGKLVDDMDEYALVNQISRLKNDEYNDSLMLIPPEQKRLIMLSLFKDDEEVLELISQQTYIKAIATEEKPEMMKGMVALDNEQVLLMLKELPKELLSIVTTQIDTDIFAEILLRDYKNLVQTFIAA